MSSAGANVPEAKLTPTSTQQIHRTADNSHYESSHTVDGQGDAHGGNFSATSRFVETMLTVIETCRQHRRNVFHFVTAAVQAHYARQTAPSLPPGA